MGIKVKQRASITFKIVFGFVWIMPIFLALIFSFYPNINFMRIPLSFVTDRVTIENYMFVFQNVPIFRYLINTMVIIIICIPCQVILSSSAAYAFSFLNIPMKETLFSIMLAGMMIPGEVTLVANYMTVQRLGLIDTYMGMVVTSLVGAGSIFMLRQTMLAIPKEMSEAAIMDGCGQLRFYVKFALPLSKSMLSAMMITSFISIYNSYFWPLLVTTKEECRPIQVGMAQLTADAFSRYGFVLAGAFISMLIPVVMFFFGQDKIVEGMTAGAVKS